MAIKTQCPVCESGDTALCISLNDVPVYCNVLYPTLEQSLQAPRGDINLVFCRECGHLFNGTFDSQKIDYSLEYENSLHYSGRFQEYAEALAEDLTQRHDLHNKSIVEIACGKGDFLVHICRLGANRGFGFDPSYERDRHSDEALGDVRIVQDYYSDEYADIDVDLLCCRHALEHIETPRQFLDIVRKAVGNNDEAVLYFEVPNSMYTLRDLGIWDIIYEHCGYFCENSLARAFSESGFAVHRLGESFGKQFLSIETSPAAKGKHNGQTWTPVASVAEHADAFEHRYAEKLATWKKRLEQFGGQGNRVVVWGAGSKGVTFLNVLKAGDEVDSIVDLNPHKQGKYVPGTGHRVVSPDYLKEYRPDIVIVMNPIYKDEIAAMVAKMGVDARIIVE
jgi:SAM-dependent methyltransferase